MARTRYKSGECRLRQVDVPSFSQQQEKTVLISRITAKGT